MTTIDAITKAIDVRRMHTGGGHFSLVGGWTVGDDIVAELLVGNGDGQLPDSEHLYAEVVYWRDSDNSEPVVLIDEPDDGTDEQLARLAKAITDERTRTYAGVLLYAFDVTGEN